MSSTSQITQDRVPVPDLFDLLCARRGWTPQVLAALDDPSHPDLADLGTMVEALHRIHESGERIVIIPDFDMDGISSGVLGHAGMAELGFNVELHTPDYRRGHDVSPADMAEIADRWPDTTAVITCDGGVNAGAGVDDAHARGWTVLVTDHHQELPPGSRADVTVDPCRLDETYPLKGICGAHVFYQVLERYALVHDPYRLWAIRLLRLFAGTGTISDVMPLVGENRQLVRDSVAIAGLLDAPVPTTRNQWGEPQPDPSAIDSDEAVLLQLLAAEHHHPVFVAALEGFALTLKAFRIADKLRGDPGEEFYGWYLAPAFNSPRRIGTPMSDCFEIFAPGPTETRLETATRVLQANQQRMEMVKDFVAELQGSDQPLAPWVYLSHAPGGMLGLLANKLMTTSGHPVVVLGAPGPGAMFSGSGRAPAWFDIIDTLAPVPHMMGIGHQQACGVRVGGLDGLAELATILETATVRILAEAGPAGLTAAPDLRLGPSPDADAGLVDDRPLLSLLERLEALHPFGHGFEIPVTEITADPATTRMDLIGSEDQHVRLTTAEGTRLLWWNAADHVGQLRQVLDDPQPTNWLRLQGTLSLNEFRGHRSVQLIVDHMVDEPARVPVTP
ncbi:DHH family phosphoesterase [Acidipropionibacterium jensenii]|uniref:DHH family phosphoesterase n=1 Tax=Acidipropionibacterium jensenii TaxID=1749 RepID=UPI00214C4966|nr:DHH family phosphoesterase [Acidipropionibacterium jensenii]